MIIRREKKSHRWVRVRESRLQARLSEPSEEQSILGAIAHTVDLTIQKFHLSHSITRVVATLQVLSVVAFQTISTVPCTVKRTLLSVRLAWVATTTNKFFYSYVADPSSATRIWLCVSNFCETYSCGGGWFFLFVFFYPNRIFPSRHLKSLYHGHPHHNLTLKNKVRVRIHPAALVRK
jgi:hypothetical protein